MRASLTGCGGTQLSAALVGALQSLSAVCELLLRFALSVRYCSFVSCCGFLVVTVGSLNSDSMDFKKFTAGAGTFFNRAKQVNNTCVFTSSCQSCTAGIGYSTTRGNANSLIASSQTGELAEYAANRNDTT